MMCACTVQRAANALLGVKTEHIARLDLALVEAFELLNAVSLTLAGCTSLCRSSVCLLVREIDNKGIRPPKRIWSGFGLRIRITSKIQWGLFVQ